MSQKTLNIRQKVLSPFLQKLYAVIHDEGSDHIISWDKSGSNILIKDIELFEKTILISTFRATKFSSF